MNLFICMTNLQMIIARRIIEEENIKNAMFIYFGDIKNKKSQHYIEQLSHFASNRVALEDPRLNGWFKTIRKTLIAKKIINKLGVHHFSTVYLANIKKSSIHHILSQITYDNLITFDDGIGNLNKQSSIYRIESPTKWERISHSIMGRSIHASDIMREIKTHYTIFENKDNLISNTKYINLASNWTLLRNEEKSNTKKVIKILLGTVYQQEARSKADTQKLINAVYAFIDEYKIDIYIPHPRDEKKYFPGVKTISSNRIAEEEILELLKVGNSIELYGFANTTQFNLSSIKNIKNYALQSPYLKDSHNFKITDLCDENFNLITI